MSRPTWRILALVSAAVLVAGLLFGANPIIHEVQQLSTTYGDGFVVLVALMTVLVLISIVKMPLTHASVRRRHR
jgi:putative copper export protein